MNSKQIKQSIIESMSVRPMDISVTTAKNGTIVIHVQNFAVSLAKIREAFPQAESRYGDRADATPQMMLAFKKARKQCQFSKEQDNYSRELALLAIAKHDKSFAGLNESDVIDIFYSTNSSFRWDLTKPDDQKAKERGFFAKLFQGILG